MHDSVTLCIGHLESISSLSYTDLANVGRVYYTILKTTVNITDGITRKISLEEYWEVVKLDREHKFCKIQFLFESLNFIVCNKQLCF